MCANNKKDPRECKECKTFFIPERINQIFCSARCRLLFGAKLYAQRHPEKVKANVYKWRENNRERYLKNEREYWKNVKYPNNKEKIKQRNKAYRQNNQEKIKAYRIQYAKIVKRNNFTKTNKPEENIVKQLKSDKFIIYIIKDEAKKYRWVSYIRNKKSIESEEYFNTKKEALLDIKKCFY